MTTTVRTPRHVEQDLACMPTEKTPYELACESGFLGSLSAEENIAGEAKILVKNAIAGKHDKQAKKESTARRADHRPQNQPLRWKDGGSGGF